MNQERSGREKQRIRKIEKLKGEANSMWHHECKEIFLHVRALLDSQRCKRRRDILPFPPYNRTEANLIFREMFDPNIHPSTLYHELDNIVVAAVSPATVEYCENLVRTYRERLQQLIARWKDRYQLHSFDLLTLAHRKYDDEDDSDDPLVDIAL